MLLVCRLCIVHFVGDLAQKRQKDRQSSKDARFYSGPKIWETCIFPSLQIHQAQQKHST